MRTIFAWWRLTDPAHPAAAACRAMRLAFGEAMGRAEAGRPSRWPIHRAFGMLDLPAAGDA